MQKRANTVNVLAKAAAVIKLCHQQDGGLSLGDISKQLNIPRATIQRIVKTLVTEGLLTKRDTARSISLSPELLAMGAAKAVDLVERTHPVLRNLALQTGETVDLSRFNRDHAVFVNQVPGSHRLLAVSAVGQTFPLHCTANGKAMLSLLSDEQLKPLLQRKLSAYTPKTITSAARLRQSLAQTLENGFATDMEEHTLGISAIGMAFTAASRDLYALSIPIPSLRFEGVHRQCIPLLRRAVQDILLLFQRPRVSI
jgi:DNA-binding IclR family transcriptional regulator